jgi:hypothetical protein
MNGHNGHGGGRPGPLVGVSVSGLTEGRAAAVAAMGAGTSPPALIWRHTSGGPTGGRPATASPDQIEVLQVTVGARLSEMRGTAGAPAPGFSPTATAALAPALVLPICFYRSAGLALHRLGDFVETSLGIRVADGAGDAAFRDFGVTSDQALGDWLRAADAAGFRAVALWPVAFATTGVTQGEFETAARHAVQLAVQATQAS